VLAIVHGPTYPSAEMGYGVVGCLNGERTMSRPDGLGCLSDEQWADLQIQVSLYEQAWQQAGPQGTVELEGFLLPPGHSLRLAYVHEFIKTDLEIQWRRGKVTLLDDYVRRFRELRSLRELPAQLIYEE